MGRIFWVYGLGLIAHCNLLTKSLSNWVLVTVVGFLSWVAKSEQHRCCAAPITVSMLRRVQRSRVSSQLQSRITKRRLGTVQTGGEAGALMPC